MFYPYTHGATTFGAADVINSSWGFTDATGNDPATIGLDGLAKAHPTTTFVVAAGNSGPSSNTVGGPASGYNCIAVGALQNNGSDGYNFDREFQQPRPSRLLRSQSRHRQRSARAGRHCRTGHGPDAGLYGGRPVATPPPWAALIRPAGLGITIPVALRGRASRPQRSLARSR